MRSIFQTELDCEVCDRHFDGLKPYRVHMRTHTGDKPYLCNAKGCQQAYISRQLLWKHQVRRHPELKVNAAKSLEEKRNKRLVQKFGASSMESILTARSVIEALIATAIPEPEAEPESEQEEGSADTSLEEQQAPKTNEDTEDGEENAEEEYDPIDAAVRSIMGPEGSFDIRKSPTKSPGRHGGAMLSPVHSNRTPPVMTTPPVRQIPPAPLPPSAANFASAMSGGMEDESEPPQLVVRGAQPGARPVAIRPQQIVGRPVLPGAQVPGGIPVVRVGQVLQSPPGMIPPPQRGANVRLPVMPGIGNMSSRPVG